MIPLFKPFMPPNLSELHNILYSDSLSYNKWGRQFESKLCEFIGNNNIITVNSYNSAVLITLSILDVKPGDEIIASPMSCLASNQPLITQGATIIWADIDPNTGTLDPESVQSKITNKTKAIIHNHYCGYVGFIDEINNIGKSHGIVVIDDAIEAFGSEYKGNKIGNLGTDITLFSFQSVRLPNTIDGGAISFKSKDLYNKAYLCRDYGINRSIFRDNLGEINSKCDIDSPGFGATLNEIFSYIGYSQMNYIDDLLSKQRANANKWFREIQTIQPNIINLGTNVDQKPNYWVFGFLTSNKKNVLQKIRNNGYYASSVHFPNNSYSVFGKYEALIGVNEFFSRFLAIPCGWWL